ncbi:MAG: hypothetical protein DME62_10395 [Verrucomicrobia bacterium]|nr:MAG: hypothetical protein DME62_10395 [Verrucomicrobiota bacterium]
MAHSLWIVRELLITLAILIACITAILASWIFGGRQLSLFIDRFGTVEIDSAKINSIAYEGSGTGGILIVNDAGLSLNETAPNLSPSMGSTKDNQFALASGGKVFAFGRLGSAAESASDHLATTTPAGDDASLVTRRSIVSWPTPFDLNFMTGQSPSWKRHIYYQLRWKKSSGATLEMLWRYEQYFYPRNGWGSGFMTREGSTGLIRLDIRP